MTVKELKEKLESRPEDTAVMVLNTERCSIEDVEVPDAFGQGDAQIVLFIPKLWGSEGSL